MQAAALFSESESGSYPSRSRRPSSSKTGGCAIFHERKALAHGEQTNIPHHMVKPYDGEVPDYTESLREATAQLRAKLDEDGSEWAKRSLHNLDILEKEYFNLP